MITSLSLQPQMEAVDTAAPSPLLCPFPCPWSKMGIRAWIRLSAWPPLLPGKFPRGGTTRQAALFLHVPGDDHTGNEKCQQPETQETWKTKESLRGSLSLLKYTECSPAVPPRPSEQVHPSPTNLIKRESARNQKCLKEQAITGSRMVSKYPGCRRRGSSAARREIPALRHTEAESTTAIKLYKHP